VPAVLIVDREAPAEQPPRELALQLVEVAALLVQDTFMVEAEAVAAPVT
jgi:hypothetical protein